MYLKKLIERLISTLLGITKTKRKYSQPWGVGHSSVWFTGLEGAVPYVY